METIRPISAPFLSMLHFDKAKNHMSLCRNSGRGERSRAAMKIYRSRIEFQFSKRKHEPQDFQLIFSKHSFFFSKSRIRQLVRGVGS
jgi:hypothetical protein